MKKNTYDKNVKWHDGLVTPDERSRYADQKGIVLWFTGLPGSGKSTLASKLEKELLEDGVNVFRLDGDNIRHGLNNDLGFSPDDRKENIRRIAEVASLFADACIITLVSFISPYKEMRSHAKEIIGKHRFFEIYVKADLKTCEERDPKGMYKKAREGSIKDFTGISCLPKNAIVTLLLLYATFQVPLGFF